MVAGTTYGPVARDQLLVLRFSGHFETATFGPHAAAALTTGATRWRNTSSRPRNMGVAEGSLKWRDPLLVHEPVRRSFALGALIQSRQ